MPGLGGSRSKFDAATSKTPLRLIRNAVEVSSMSKADVTSFGSCIVQNRTERVNGGRIATTLTLLTKSSSITTNCKGWPRFRSEVTTVPMGEFSSTTPSSDSASIRGMCKSTAWTTIFRSAVDECAASVNSSAYSGVRMRLISR